MSERAKTVNVLDTTVLIDNPNLPYELTDGDVVIPVAVLRELDGLKNSDVISVAKAAREVSRLLDRVGSYGDLREGVRLSTGSVLRLYPYFEPVDLLASDGDNRVLGAALRLKNSEGITVNILTTDVNMRIAARSLGIDTHLEGNGCSVGLRSAQSGFSVNSVAIRARPRVGLFLFVIAIVFLVGISMVGFFNYAVVAFIFLLYYVCVVRPLARKSTMSCGWHRWHEPLEDVHDSRSIFSRHPYPGWPFGNSDKK